MSFGRAVPFFNNMSKSDILRELPELSKEERREIVEVIFKLESDAELLSDCDRRAAERFALLDALEAEDAQTKAQ